LTGFSFPTRELISSPSLSSRFWESSMYPMGIWVSGTPSPR
jgi:hypothetical protein